MSAETGEDPPSPGCTAGQEEPEKEGVMRFVSGATLFFSRLSRKVREQQVKIPAAPQFTNPDTQTLK